jgi:hypothetical protein
MLPVMEIHFAVVVLKEHPVLHPDKEVVVRVLLVNTPLKAHQHVYHVVPELILQQEHIHVYCVLLESIRVPMDKVLV